MPDIVRELDVDPVRQRAFAGTGSQVFMIDLSRPAAPGRSMPTVTASTTGSSGRRRRSLHARGGRHPPRRDRGLLYVGGVAGMDTWAVYDNCCDLGVEMTAARHDRQTGNRAELLQKEKDALSKGISAGLAAAAQACSVTTGTMSILEQGSGACLWKRQPGDQLQRQLPAGRQRPRLRSLLSRPRSRPRRSSASSTSCSNSSPIR